MRLAIERRAMRNNATWKNVPDDRLPMAQHDAVKGTVQVRGVDAGMQAAQAALRGKAAYTSRGGRITFIDGDQLGQCVRI